MSADDLYGTPKEQVVEFTHRQLTADPLSGALNSDPGSYKSSYFNELTRRPQAGPGKSNSMKIPTEVQSEMNRLHNKLSEANHPLAPLALALTPVLGARTAHGFNEKLENTFTNLQKGASVQVAGVLAHTTALTEAHPMIEAAEVLNSFLSVKLRVVLTHWDTLAAPSPAETFDVIADGVERLLKNTNMNTELVVLNRNAMDTPPFIQARNETWNPEVGTPCAEDLDWMVGFYGRQRSFRPLGREQAIRDFTMRRALGLLIADLAPNLALLTEKKERLARCYRCPCPALNVKI